jgi:raffinose/stachyose/melibiose transport system substrate-binding protein
MKKRLVLLSVVFLCVAILVGTGEAKTQIRWSGWFPTQEDSVTLKKLFETENPEIEFTYAYSQYNDYVNGIRAEFAAGSGPDVLSIQPGAIFTTMKPYLLDLTPKLGDWSKQIVPVFIEAAKAAGDGKALYLPIGNSAQMFVYYNATLFQEAGVQKLPETGAEFIAIVETLKQKYPDKVIFPLGLKDPWYAADVFNLFANMVSPGITDKADKGEVKWNSDVFVKAMTIFKDLVAKNVIPKESVALQQYEDAIGLLHDRKALMNGNGSWNMGNLSQKYGDRRKMGGRATDKDVMGAFVLPNFAGGKPVTIGGMDVGIAVNKDSKNLDAALKVVQFMTVGSGQKWFTTKEDSGLVPAKIGLQKSAEAYPDKASQDGVKAIIDGYNNYLVASRENSNPEVKNQLAVALQNIVNGNDIKKELDAIQKIAENQ